MTATVTFEELAALAIVHPPTFRPPGLSVPRCAACGKVCYPTRRAARRARRRLYPGEHMRAYLCGTVFHIGHLPYAVRVSSVVPEWEPAPGDVVTQIHGCAS